MSRGISIMKNDMLHLKFYNLDCEVNYWYREGREDKWVLFFSWSWS